MIELEGVIYFEENIGTSQGPREIMFKEQLVFIPVSIAFTPISSHVVFQHPIATSDNEPIEEVNIEALEIHLQSKEGF